jgi:hypothetical protein
LGQIEVERDQSLARTFLWSKLVASWPVVKGAAMRNVCILVIVDCFSQEYDNH